MTTELQKDFVSVTSEDLLNALEAEPDEMVSTKWRGVMYELIDIVEARLLRCNDMPAKQARRYAVDAILAIAEFAGGRQIYLPKLHQVKHEIRNQKIYAEFNGSNMDDLAAKYRLTTRALYTIIKQQRTHAVNKVQSDLFN